MGKPNWRYCKTKMIFSSDTECCPAGYIEIGGDGNAGAHKIWLGIACYPRMHTEQSSHKIPTISSPCMCRGMPKEEAGAGPQKQVAVAEKEGWRGTSKGGETVVINISAGGGSNEKSSMAPPNPAHMVNKVYFILKKSANKMGYLVL